MHRLINERVIVQFGLFLVAVALFLSTFQQSFTASDMAQSPMFFPRIILVLWMVLSAIALVQTVQEHDVAPPIASWARIVIVIAAAMVYANAIGSEGFFLPSVVFALISLPAFGIRSPLLVLLFAVLVPGSLVLLFNHTLGMPLPTSRFTYFF